MTVLFALSMGVNSLVQLLSLRCLHSVTLRCLLKKGRAAIVLKSWRCSIALGICYGRILACVIVFAMQLRLL